MAKGTREYTVFVGGEAADHFDRLGDAEVCAQSAYRETNLSVKIQGVGSREGFLVQYRKATPNEQRIRS